MEANDKPSSPAEASPEPARPRSREQRKVGRSVLIGTAAFVFVVVLLLAAAASAVWWAVRTESGTARLLALVPGVEVEAPRGTLIGQFEARRIGIRLPGTAGDRIEITELGWKGLRVERASGAAWLRIAIDELRARRVAITLPPDPKTEPLKPPADLQLPIELDVAALRVGELAIDAIGDKPMLDLQARVQLGASAGGLHRVDSLRLVWDRLQLEGQAQIASRSPFALDVQLQARQSIAQPSTAASAPGAAASAPTAAASAASGTFVIPAWNARASLKGPLEQPALQATLRADAQPGRDAQTLDARATLRPFAAWPLGELSATMRALDLAAFSSAAPATSLSGDATATSRGIDQPARVKATLNNALAGRWNEARLPLRRIDVELGAVPKDPNTLELSTFDAELGSTSQAAGRVSGRGRWTRDRWNIDIALADLQPSLLDARAPSMRLAGPLRATGTGFDSTTTNAQRIELQGELRGQLSDRGPARAVAVKLDASASARRIDVRSIEASAGTARATLSGTADRGSAADAPWAVKAKSTLIDFDPAPWWPGGADSAWRNTSNHLNANAVVDLQIPATAPSGAATAWLAALRGKADLTIAEGSVLASVPLSAEVHVANSDGAQLSTKLNVKAAGNTLASEGKLATRGDGSGDAWTLQLDAAALDRLAPLYKVLQNAGADATLAGRVSASGQIKGRWPSITSQGQLTADALRVGASRIEHAEGKWQAGSSADAPLDAQLTLNQLAMASNGKGPAPSIESAQLLVKGSARTHTIELRADSKSLPPAWTDALQTPAPANAAASAPAGARTLALLQSHGGLMSDNTGWHGAVDRLEVRTSGNAPLLQTQAVAFEFAWGGSSPRALVQPGRADILGAALRWSRIEWHAASAAGAPAQIDAEAELDPLRISPLLARAQPDFGWGGDLTVGGKLSIHSAPAFRADIVLERRSGDLTVTEELGTQALGLTDLRLGLNASDGVWSFTQALAGKTVGVAAGAIVARTSPQATWPSADTPIEGVLELQVANLGTWGPWVPPGWRLDGALHTSASIAGRFGAPEYTGQIKGSSIAVRNFLEGVAITDGDVSIRLQGQTATIESFTAKAGSGTIKIDGSAEFGEAPVAKLKLLAEKFQVLGRVDRRIVASGQAQMRLDSKTVALEGRFDVDEGLVDFTRSDAPSLASDVEVVRASNAPSPAAAASAAASPAAKPVVAAPTVRQAALDLRVGLGENLRVRGRGLDAGLRGELHITSPGGRLAVNGTVRAVDGTYRAYGQKLSIDRGLITFNGPVENPRLDIEATRPNLDVRVGVAISGTPANPRVRLFSEPELSDIDKLSWLVMGRASDGLGRTDTALLQRAALALLSGEGSSPTDELTKAIGIDEISVRQSDGQGQGQVRETVVSLGKQLSRRWYVGYERGLNSTAGNWQLIYRIAQRFTLRAQSGLDNSLDLIWTWRWQ